MFKPLKVVPKDNYKIYLEYDDGVSGEVDLSHLAGKGVFQYWNDYNNFKKVYINTESHAIAWSEEIDICPDNLYLKLKKAKPDTILKKHAFSK
jgi:hypothetical protein